MEESADQLILEYLGRVADVAHRHLASHERLDFMIRLRGRIEQDRRGSADPARVRKVLARFGDPERLVARERRRLDDAGAAIGPRGASAPVPALDPASGRPVRAPAPGSRSPRDAAGGDHAGARGAAGGGRRADTLRRRHPLEAGALGLAGLGGLLLPIPLWLFGAGLVAYSGVWTARDKLIGLGGPLVAAGIGVLVRGSTHTGAVVDFAALGEAINTTGTTILRIAGPAGVIFLGVRLLRGARAGSMRRARRRQRL